MVTVLYCSDTVLSLVKTVLKPNVEEISAVMTPDNSTNDTTSVGGDNVTASASADASVDCHEDNTR